jgi:hypothetical protein
VRATLGGQNRENERKFQQVEMIEHFWIISHLLAVISIIFAYWLGNS